MGPAPFVPCPFEDWGLQQKESSLGSCERQHWCVYVRVQMLRTFHYHVTTVNTVLLFFLLGFGEEGKRQDGEGETGNPAQKLPWRCYHNWNSPLQSQICCPIAQARCCQWLHQSSPCSLWLHTGYFPSSGGCHAGSCCSGEMQSEQDVIKLFPLCASDLEFISCNHWYVQWADILKSKMP